MPIYNLKEAKQAKKKIGFNLPLNANHKFSRFGSGISAEEENHTWISCFVCHCDILHNLMEWGRGKEHQQMMEPHTPSVNSKLGTKTSAEQHKKTTQKHDISCNGA